MIRINKYLSTCGVSSRRGAEKLIAEGRVTLNGETVDKVGTIIDETRDKVLVDGNPVTPSEKLVYVVLNKPRQTMTTLHDPFRRRTVVQLLAGLKERVYPIGRLDFDTLGVLLLTNDGELAYRLTHPKYEIVRVYEARVKGQFKLSDGKAIENGIKLEDGAIGRAKVQLLQASDEWSRVRLLLKEGRKREVKQLCKATGHPVLRLNRIEFAGIRATGIESGGWRYLDEKEIASLKELVGM